MTSVSNFSLFFYKENEKNKREVKRKDSCAKMIIKRGLAFFTLTILIFSLVSGNVFATECHGKSFYIKKNGNLRPILPDDEKAIEMYDAFYIDPCKTDGDTDKVLYLTFDAGYENGNVEKILDTLKEENAPGAFFLLGHIIRKNTDLVKRMSREGHIVCNHTENHADMTQCSKEEMCENLSRLESVYKEQTGETMEKFFRFPEGKYDEDHLSYAKEMGYKTFFWSLAYADWDNNKQMNTEKAKKILLENTHNGAIILLHPTSSTNAEILPDLIKAWRAMGYRFGSLKEFV